MKAIFKREINSYLSSPTGYAFLGILLGLWGLLFAVNNLGNKSADLSAVFSFMIYFMMVLIPLLTMRLISEEKATKTDQLLLTAPISTWDIILGKFFAAFTLILIAMLGTIPHLAVLIVNGNPALLQVAFTYVGFILLCGVYLAIGLFISALTENQVVSAVVTFSIFIGLMLIELMIIPRVGNDIIFSILSWFSLVQRFSDINLGILNIAPLIYYVSLIAAFLFFATRSLEKHKKGMKQGLNSMAFTAVVMAALVFVNLITGAVSQKYDLTPNKVYSLSKETLGVLSTLDENITIYFIEDKENRVPEITETLASFPKNSKKISIANKEIEKDPVFQKKYNVKTFNSIVVEGEKKGKVIDSGDLFDKDELYTKKSSKIEGQIAAAINYVTSNKTPIIQFTTGHNEADFYDAHQTLLGENIDSYPINLMTDEIKSVVDLIVIPGPAKDFNQEEIKKLDDYLERGGRVQYYSNPKETLPNLNAYLIDEWGISVSYDAVFDDKSVTTNIENVSYMLPVLRRHAITEYFMDTNGKLIWPYQTFSNSIDVLEKPGVETNILVTTSNKGGSYKVEDLSAESVPIKNGELVLSVYCRKNSINNENTTARLMVSGAYDAMFKETVPYINKDYFIRTINYMAGFTEAPISIQTKKIVGSVITVTETQSTLYTAILCGVLPIMLFVLGLWVWLRRRKL